MLSIRMGLSAALIFLFTNPVFPQQPAQQTSIVLRDPQAIKILQQTIAALGGATALSSVTAASTHASIVPVPDSQLPSGTVVWEDDFTGPSYEFRDTFQSDGFTRTLVSGHGSPGQIDKDGDPHKLQSHVAYAAVPYQLPAIVLNRDLSDSNRTVTFIGTTALAGKSVLHIRTSIDVGIVEKLLSPHDWYIDASTFLPIRVEYDVPNTINLSDIYLSAVDYSDYRPINGILFPFTQNVSERGNPVCVVQVSAIDLNPPTSSTDFDLPAIAVQPTGGAQ